MNAYQYEIEVIHAVFNGGLSPNACEVIDALEPEMFSGSFHVQIWKEIKKAYSSGDLIEPSTVYMAVDKVDGINIYIGQRNSVTGSSHNIKGYAKRVRQAHFLRMSKESLQNALEAINNCTEAHQIGEAAKSVEDALRGLTIETDSKKPRSIDEVMDDYMEILSLRIEGHESQRMIRTGIEEFDKKTGGFNPTDLIIIGGTPGMGKTEFIMTITRSLARNKLGSLAFSLEMSDFQLAERAISGEGNMPVGFLRNPQDMDDEQHTKLGIGVSQLKGAGIYIQDTAQMTVEQICQQATRHKVEHPELSMIWVDYLGLIDIPKGSNLTVAYGEITSRLKRLAKEISVPVALLVQLVSKKIEERPLKSRIPKASDIKESSRVQDDADWIIFPHRQKVYDENAPTIAEIVLAKARHGISGDKCYMDFVNGHFVDVNQMHAYNLMENYYKKPDNSNGGMFGDKS